MNGKLPSTHKVPGKRIKDKKLKNSDKMIHLQCGNLKTNIIKER